MIKLMVGLGNPGTEYEHTRHNVGFWWIDALADKLGVSLAAERSYFGLIARVNRPALGVEGPLWLLEPMTYMNLSGKSVAALAKFFKIAPQEILMIHDELDLLPGHMKLKQGGGVAGHNGLKDTQAKLGSAEFWRLRIGIGHPGFKGEVANYVLGKPKLEDREAIMSCVERSLQAVPALCQGDMQAAIRLIHSPPARPKPPKPEGTVPAPKPDAQRS